VIVLTTLQIVKEIVMEMQKLMNAVSVEEQEFQKEHVTVKEKNSIVKIIAVEVLKKIIVVFAEVLENLKLIVIALITN